MKLSLYPPKLFFTRWPVAVAGSLAIAGNLSAWLWLWLRVPRTGGQMVLHYTVLFGVDRVGPYRALYYAPALGLAVLLVNLAIGWLLYRQDKFIAELLMAVAAAVQIAVFFSSYLLVLLNA